MKKINSGFCLLCREWCVFVTKKNDYCRGCHDRLKNLLSEEPRHAEKMGTEWGKRHEARIHAHQVRIAKEEARLAG